MIDTNKIAVLMGITTTDPDFIQRLIYDAIASDPLCEHREELQSLADGAIDPSQLSADTTNFLKGIQYHFKKQEIIHNRGTANGSAI